MNIFKSITLSLAMCSAALPAVSAPDANFHIYLCIGQSNMEGNAAIEPSDRINVPERFKMMAAVDYNNPSRKLGEWYVATPPLVREGTGLTPMDYFGRTMVDNLPEDVKVGVIAVAIGGCRIEHLDKDFDASTLANEADWFKSYMRAYDNAPYARLLACAKKAQDDGVIKGILLHQGESNNGDREWGKKVRKIYNDLLADLGLEPNSIPLLAGQVVTSEQGGVCGGMNPIINTLPETLSVARVVSAANLPQKGDGLHFTAHGYRVLGCRYATEMLATMGITDPKVAYSEEIPFIPTPKPSEGDFVFDFKYFNPTVWEKGTFDPQTGVFVPGQYGFGGWEYETPIDLSGYRYIVADLNENTDGWTSFRIFDTPSYWETPYEGKFNDGRLIVAELDGMMKNLQSGIVPLNTAKVYRVGFWGLGNKPISIKQVYATNNNPFDAVADVPCDIRRDDHAVYDLMGRRVAESLSDSCLIPGFYLCEGQKIILKR